MQVETLSSDSLIEEKQLDFAEFLFWKPQLQRKNTDQYSFFFVILTSLNSDFFL